MKTLIFSSVAILATGVLGFPLLAMTAAPPPSPPYPEGQVLVKFLPGVPEEGRERVLIEEGARVERALGGSGVLLVALPPGRSVPEGVSGFSRHPEVEYAEPNYRVRAH